MIDDLDFFEKLVASLNSTIDKKIGYQNGEKLGKKYEDLGDSSEKKGYLEEANKMFLQAKTYYSIGRFPSEISHKAEVSKDLH